MPRYFFNTEDGKVVCDPDGEVLPNDDIARLEAVRLLGAVLKDEPEDFLEECRWRVTVSEQTRGNLFTIEVSMKIGDAISDWGDGVRDGGRR